MYISGNLILSIIKYNDSKQYLDIQMFSPIALSVVLYAFLLSGNIVSWKTNIIFQIKLKKMVKM